MDEGEKTRVNSQIIISITLYKVQRKENYNAGERNK